MAVASRQAHLAPAGADAGACRSNRPTSASFRAGASITAGPGKAASKASRMRRVSPRRTHCHFCASRWVSLRRAGPRTDWWSCSR